MPTTRKKKKEEKRMREKTSCFPPPLIFNCRRCCCFFFFFFGSPWFDVGDLINTIVVDSDVVSRLEKIMKQLFVYLVTLSAAGGLRVLTTHSDAPIVTQTSVDACLLQSLNVVTELGVEGGGDEVLTLASGEIFLVVKHPVWYFKCLWAGDDSDHSLDFILCKFTGTFVGINLSFFQNNMSEATSNTWNLSDCEQNFDVTINVGVENTEDVLELFGLNEGCHNSRWIKEFEV